MPYFRFKSKQIIDFIENKSQHKPILILIGARQVGKTTVVTSALGKRAQLALNLEESPAIADDIDRCPDFAAFSLLLKSRFAFDHADGILFIDEAQQSRRLGAFVRFMHEKWTGATVILTGSTMTELHADGHREPVGRETYLELWPMNFREFLMAGGQEELAQIIAEFTPGDEIDRIRHDLLMEHYGTYLKTGGLPRVVSDFLAGEDWRKRRADIFKSYENDFIRYFSLEEVNLFKRCLAAIAANVGSPSKDSQAVEINRPGYKKVAGIFARLEKWRMVVKCEQLGVEPEKNRFHPKRYLHDVGILGDLRWRGIPEIGLVDLSRPACRTPLGGILENAVALALRDATGEDLVGMRVTPQSEIDFIVKKDGEPWPVECKAALRFKEKFISPLRAYLTRFSPRSSGILFYAGLPLTKEIAKVRVLPFYLAEEIQRLISAE